jgi:6-pyruvoyl-tetrahydropterin synthase
MTAIRASARPLVRARVGGAGWDFNAAHAGLHDGVFEPLHGHTYQVSVAVSGTPDHEGVVVDFSVIKQQLRQVIAPLKSRTLIAARAPGVTVEETREGHLRVSGGGACFNLPRSWVTLLPTVNTSTEAVAGYLATELAQRARAACLAIACLELTLAESAECAATVEAALR